MIRFLLYSTFGEHQVGMMINITVSTHAVHRCYERFPERFETLSPAQVKQKLVRMFRRGKRSKQWDCSEARRKGNLYIIARYMPDEHGDFGDRHIVTIYKGKYPKEGIA